MTQAKGASLYIRRAGSFGSSCDGVADTGHHIVEDGGKFNVWSIHDDGEQICTNGTRQQAEQAIAADWRRG